MNKLVKTMAVVFVVSWTDSFVNNAVPCKGKEDAGIICVKQAPHRTEKVMKTAEAAHDFFAVMQDMKATDLKMEQREK